MVKKVDLSRDKCTQCGEDLVLSGTKLSKKKNGLQKNFFCCVAHSALYNKLKNVNSLTFCSKDRFTSDL